MKEWDVNIYRGILTGYNEAFIINQETRDKLVGASSKNAEIIRPILLGKNIKRYDFEWDNKWLINAHNGIKSKRIERVDIVNDYPSVFEYLKQFEDQLKMRLDKGDHWTNLRNCAYLEEFKKPKIAWGNLALNSQFCYIPDDYVINAPSPFFTTNNFYLLAILNSKIANYYIKQMGVSRSGGYMEYKPMFVEKLPIPLISQVKQDVLIELATKILFNKTNKLSTAETEHQINTEVYKLYKLTEAEIFFIEST